MVPPEQALCPDDTQLAGFADRSLDPVDCDAVELHIHSCESCRTALAHVVAVDTSSGGRGGHAHMPGDTIGRFGVLGVLGVGGMGVVCSAYDQQLDRKVAIKLLRADFADESHRLRLLREAQAMAKIDHLNVIKVHDVGTHDDEVYVAMELADAGTVRAWLAAQPRSMREILAVFVQAGRGLAAAHAVGLIHRDFKPDNVLMFSGGRVCVTDFGLVGVESGDGDDAIATSVSVTSPLAQNLTRTGSIMGTPLYMSPEQFEGKVATASSDQFSFCVALYEAVYGVPPFKGRTFADLAETVGLGEVAPAPDGGTVPRWLRSALLRGLALAPADRFPSMTVLLDELARDRLRRRRMLGIAGGVAALGLTFALWPRSAVVSCDGGEQRVAAVWNPARQHQLEAAFAESRRPHALATVARLGSMFDAWGRTWASGHRDACEATRVRGEQSEHALDLRMQCLTDRLDETRATLDVLGAGGGATVDRALDAVMQLPSVEPCARAATLAAVVRPPATEIMRVQVQAAKLRVDEARAFLRLGRYDSARTVAMATLGAARDTTYQPLVAETLLVLGEAQLALADARAIDSLREASHLARAAGDISTEVAASAGLVSALTTLRGKYDVALEISEAAYAATTSSRPRAELLIKLANARGDLDVTRGKPAEARARYERALALAETELGPDHVAVLTTLERLGNVLKVEGKFADARKLHERVLATRQRVEAPDHPDVATALNSLGNVSRAEGKLDDARQLYERGLALRIASLGPDHPAVAESYNNLGTFDAEQGDLVGARRHFDQAIALYEKVYGPDSVEIAETVMNLGSALVGRGELDAARVALVRARKLYEAAAGPDDRHVAYVISELGVIDEREGKLDDALAMIRRATQIAEKALGPDHPDLADYLERESSVLDSQNQLASAEAIAVRALQLYQKAYGREHPRVGMALAALARLQGKRGEYKEALDSWQQSLAIFEARLRKNHPNLSFALAGIGDALTELGRAPEALPYLERAMQIRTDAKMPPSMVAEIHFYLGAALVGSPETRGRAITEVRTALALYQQGGDEDNVREMRTWLAKHR